MSDQKSIDRPTILPKYYAYRLTVPHSEWESVREILTRYSQDWVGCMHFPDDYESGCMSEHFHFAFRDFDKNKVDAFKKANVAFFGRGGNGLHAGSWRDNAIDKAVGYMKHDEHATFYHSGQDYWDEIIASAEPFVKGAGGKMVKIKEKLSSPMLTYSNVIKQALKYRTEHAMFDTDSLQNVLSRMVNAGTWIPSRELLRNGVPRELHEMFKDRVNGTTREYNWMKPHVPSEDKLKWLDRPDTTPIVAGCASSGPGNSKRMWKDKDFSKEK